MFLTLCIHIPLISFHIRYDAALKQRSELKLKMRRNSVELKLACIDYDIIFTSKPSIIKTYLSQICTQKIHVFTCAAHKRNLYVPGFLIVRQVHLACFTSGLETYPFPVLPHSTAILVSEILAEDLKLLVAVSATRWKNLSLLNDCREQRASVASHWTMM